MHLLASTHSYARAIYLIFRSAALCGKLPVILFSTTSEREQTKNQTTRQRTERRETKAYDAIKIQLAQRQRGRDVKFGLEERIQKGWGIQLSPLWQVHVSNWGSLSSISSQTMW